MSLGYAETLALTSQSDSLAVTARMNERVAIDDRDDWIRYARKLEGKLARLRKVLDATEQERDHAQADLMATRWTYLNTMEAVDASMEGNYTIPKKRRERMTRNHKVLADIIYYDYLYSKGYATKEGGIPAHLSSRDNEDRFEALVFGKQDLANLGQTAHWISPTGLSTNYTPRYPVQSTNVPSTKYDNHTEKYQENAWYLKGQKGEKNFKVR
jgi:hypothetical protein